uniref:Uncharacterized protein n=1 Tax=Arion vulgaris TaxID=1028688 RepID=A0A0B7BUC5_9EUPU
MALYDINNCSYREWFSSDGLRYDQSDLASCYSITQQMWYYEVEFYVHKNITNSSVQICVVLDNNAPGYERLGQ